MDFALDENQQAIAGLAAEVLRGEVDLERVLDQPGYDERAWRALAKAGLLSLALPADLGGDGLGVAEVAVVLTEVGRAAAPVPALATLALGVLPLERLGGPAQRAEFLPPVAAGDAILTAALHEPSDPLTRAPATAATSADGRWSLSGTKITVPFAAQARRILVPASTPGETAIFLVDPRAPGVTITPVPGALGGSGHTVRLDDVRVSEEDRLPGERPVETLHACAIAGAAALADGVLAGALELTTKHVGSRQQFGKPLAEFQAVSQQIADVYIAARTVRLAALAGAWRLANGLDPDRDLAIAAYWVTSELPRAIGHCHHLHGGLGMDVDYPLHHYYALAGEVGAQLGGAAATLDRVGELVAR